MKLTPKNTLFAKLTLAALCVYMLSSCGETKTETNATPVDSLAPKAMVDTVDFAILPFDSTTHLITGFPKDLKAAELNDVDKQLIHSLMEDLVSVYNNDLIKNKKAGKSTDSLTSAIDLNAYKKQYIAVMNARGEKEVWANCFCKAIEKRIEFVDWKKIPVKVIDGGNCFFHVKLNLSQRKTYDLSVNSLGG
jgi:hypothetical protein